MTTVAQSPFPNNPDRIDTDLLWGASFERMLEEDALRELAQAWPIDAFPTADGDEPDAAEKPAPAPGAPTASEKHADQVSIGGRAYQVVDEMTLEQVREASPWAASWWQRKGIVARCEVRLARRGRRSYLADRLADGTYSRPFPGSLATPYAAA